MKEVLGDRELCSSVYLSQSFINRSKVTLQLCPFLNAVSGEGLQQHVSNRVCL